MAAAKSLTSAELDQVLSYIATTRHAQRDRAIFLMSVLSGARVGEIAQLTGGDVVDDAGNIKAEIYMAADRVKHKHAGKIYINSRLRDELAAYGCQQQFKSNAQAFFYSQQRKAQGFSANTLTQHLRSLYRAAGVFGASSHSGRKTCLSSLAAQGVSVYVIAKIARHKRLETTMRYVTVNDDMIRKAVELV